MAEEIFLKDSYLQACEATVQSANGKYIVLDKTIFYPRGGGQPSDTGKLIRLVDNAEFNVIFAGKFEGNVSHEIDKEGLQAGDKVKCILNWQRRHMLMRMHTAAHVLSAIIHNDTGALITGNSLEMEESRIDFNLENFDREKLADYVKQANEAIAKGHEIRAETMLFAEAMKIPSVVKLAGVLPPNLPTLRVVFIGDVDTQADGGLHVKNTQEIGQIEITRADNKGKTNRRIYFRLNKSQ